MFYWKVKQELAWSSPQKLFALFVAIIIVLVSIMSLGNFIYMKIEG